MGSEFCCREAFIFGSIDLRGLGKAVGEGLQAVGWV